VDTFADTWFIMRHFKTNLSLRDNLRTFFLNGGIVVIGIPAETIAVLLS
jgi:hypothetical protein